MTLSTRQLADLAGTTVKTVRHYHDIGLLDLPERSSNGYKQYTVSHLMRVLQIKRFSDLGVALSDIPVTAGADQHLDQILLGLDGEIAAKIERLLQIRAELDIILRDHSAIDVPVEFGEVARVLSDSDRALLLVYSRVFNEQQLTDVKDMLLDRDPLAEEYDTLPADAEAETIEALAERYLPSIRRQLAEHPWMSRSGENARPREGDAQNIVAEAVLALYNPAQRAVTARIHEILQNETAVANSPDDPTTPVAN